MIITKRLLPEQQLLFRQLYHDLSGLDIPGSFLCENRVYGFYHRSRLIGGFILAENPALRTIEVFAQCDNRSPLYSKINDLGRCTEVCCFWMSLAYRKRAGVNAYAWLVMALYGSLRFRSKMILFGTNSTGLAKMYAYPKNSLLFHRDRIEDKETYIFIAKRIHFFAGVFTIVWSKLMRRNIPNGLETKPISFVS